MKPHLSKVFWLLVDFFWSNTRITKHSENSTNSSLSYHELIEFLTKSSGSSQIVTQTPNPKLHFTSFSTTFLNILSLGETVVSSLDLTTPFIRRFLSFLWLLHILVGLLLNINRISIIPVWQHQAQSWRWKELELVFFKSWTKKPY